MPNITLHEFKVLAEEFKVLAVLTGIPGTFSSNKDNESAGASDGLLSGWTRLVIVVRVIISID